MRQRRGFTLIELMIVIAIIAIIAAAALPSLLRSRISANEASAIATLRAIVSTEETVRQEKGTYVPVTDLAAQREIALTPVKSPGGPTPTSPPPTDDPWAGCDATKAGYRFFSGPLPWPSPPCPPEIWEEAFRYGYFVLAEPLEENVTGVRVFYSDFGGVIRQHKGKPEPPPPNFQILLNWAQRWPPID